MDERLNALLQEQLNQAGVPPDSGAHRLSCTIADLIEIEQGYDDAEQTVRTFATRMIEEDLHPTTALELLHFISAHMAICPIRRKRRQ